MDELKITIPNTPHLHVPLDLSVTSRLMYFEHKKTGKDRLKIELCQYSLLFKYFFGPEFRNCKEAFTDQKNIALANACLVKYTFSQIPLKYINMSIIP